jgi:AmmeMemoRadiSam system protein A
MKREYRNILLDEARESIRSKLFRVQAHYDDLDAPLFHEVRGAFVTLHIEGKLRGCIGNIEGRKELRSTIRELAISSAFSDPRFPPLSVEEYPGISIEISVLTPLVEISGIEEIMVGRDGILIEYGTSSAVFLPQVAVEQDWDRDTTLAHLCRKAGLSSDAFHLQGMKFYTFQAEVFSEANY